MIYKHKNDRDKDIQETIPNLHIDLEKAVETHTIRDTGVVPEFNGIETPLEVGTLIRDRFQAIDETNRLAQLMRQTAQAKAAPTPEPSLAPTPEPQPKN